MGIIQAMQHDPELLILDEPTEGLDPLLQRAFYEALDDRRRAGRTIFFSSHMKRGWCVLGSALPPNMLLPASKLRHSST